MRRGRLTPLLLAVALVGAAAACRPVTEASETAPGPAPANAASGTTPSHGFTFVGQTFDTCIAPTTSQMATWRATSPYGAAGLYIGGRSAACPPSSYPHVNSSWVQTVGQQGWQLLPLWVGRQAPCTSYSQRFSYDLGTASNQGIEEANDAVYTAIAFGFGPAVIQTPGAPVYYDLEHYNRATPGCTQAVQAFMSAFVNQVHAWGFSAGFYSSGSSGITDMVNAVGTGWSTPDQLWFAHWNNVNDAYNSPYVPNSYWVHARHHQYRGGHVESYGGVAINIDSSASDGMAAAPGINRRFEDFPPPTKP